MPEGRTGTDSMPNKKSKPAPGGKAKPAPKPKNEAGGKRRK
jgi:hypothetical protein